MVSDDDSSRLARVEEKVISIMAWQSQHSKEDDKREVDSETRFERMFTYIKDRHDKTDAKLDTIWDERNSNIGAIKAGKIMWGGVYSVLALVAAYIGVKVGK